jgi:PLP dependent protein
MSQDALAAAFAAARARITAAAARAGRDPGEVALLAVSKGRDERAIRDAHALGQRAFGENRVQELAAKAQALAELEGVAWHFIGSLQSNKVRALLRVPRLALLHSLDRTSLADELQRELDKQSRALDVLLQIDATGDADKHGCAPADAEALLAHVQQSCPRLAVRGVMAMGPLAGDPAPVFAEVAAARDRLRRSSGLALDVLSLGMSGDLDVAIAAGSTLVRVGSALFG